MADSSKSPRRRCDREAALRHQTDRRRCLCGRGRGRSARSWKGSEGPPQAPRRDCLTLTLAHIPLWTSRALSSASEPPGQDASARPRRGAVGGGARHAYLRTQVSLPYTLALNTGILRSYFAHFSIKKKVCGEFLIVRPEF